MEYVAATGRNVAEGWEGEWKIKQVGHEALLKDSYLLQLMGCPGHPFELPARSSETENALGPEEAECSEASFACKPFRF